MPEDMKMKIIIDAAVESWQKYTKEYGDQYTDEHHDEIAEMVKEDIEYELEEAERDYRRDMEMQRFDFEDQYYTENAYGFVQQDMIDLRRFER